MIEVTDDLVRLSFSLPDSMVLVAGLVVSTVFVVIAAWKWLKRIVL